MCRELTIYIYNMIMISQCFFLILSFFIILKNGIIFGKNIWMYLITYLPAVTQHCRLMNGPPEYQHLAIQIFIDPPHLADQTVKDRNNVKNDSSDYITHFQSSAVQDL